MQIQTKRARDTPLRNIKRDGLETQIAERSVDNRHFIISKQEQRIRTLVRRKKLRLTKPKKIQRIIRSKRKIHTAVSLGNQRISEKREPKTEKENAVSAMPVQPTGGRIQTAVGRKESGAGIKTAVNRPVTQDRNIERDSVSAKDISNVVIPGNAFEVAENKAGTSIIKTSRSPKIGTKLTKRTASTLEGNVRSLIKTRTDNSTVSDTGAESAKFAAGNYRRAEGIVKTAYQGSVMAVHEIKETPKAVKRDVQKLRENMIRKNREKQLKRKKKSRVPILSGKSEASITDNVVSKKGKGLLLIAAALAIIVLFLILLYGFLPMVVTVIVGLFSWAIPDTDTPQDAYLEEYRNMVRNAEYAIIADIDSEVGYVPEYRYDGTEITGLKQYGDVVLNVDENAVVAAVAVLQFENGTNEIPESKVAEIIRDFFEIEVTKTHGYCPGHDCKMRVERVPYSTSSSTESAVTDTSSGFYEREVHYCDNPEHTYYNATVRYNDTDDVLNDLGFTDEQKQQYEMYYEILRNGGF